MPKQLFLHFYYSGCDFFVDVHTHCFYGRWSYTGAVLGGWTNRVNVFVKKGYLVISTKNQKEIFYICTLIKLILSFGNIISGTEEDPSLQALIDSKFDAYFGSKSHSNSHYIHWPYGIWAHYSNVPNEGVCAFRCFVDTLEHCSFYFWGNGHCQLGHYNYRGHKLSGSYDGDTEYRVRKDLGMYDKGINF